MNPNFSRVFQVKIWKHGSEEKEEFLKVLADDIEEAIEKGYLYASMLDDPGMFCYEVTEAQLWYSIFVGVEDDVEEIEIVPESV